MEEVSASLHIEVLTECPHCESQIDLLRDSDTGGYSHNDEGEVLSQACPDGHWTEEHKNFSVTNVTCSHCENSFNVKGLEW